MYKSIRCANRLLPLGLPLALQLAAQTCVKKNNVNYCIGGHVAQWLFKKNHLQSPKAFFGIAPSFNLTGKTSLFTASSSITYGGLFPFVKPMPHTHFQGILWAVSHHFNQFSLSNLKPSNAMHLLLPQIEKSHWGPIPLHFTPQIAWNFEEKLNFMARFGLPLNELSSFFRIPLRPRFGVGIVGTRGFFLELTGKLSPELSCKTHMSISSWSKGLKAEAFFSANVHWGDYQEGVLFDLLQDIQDLNSMQLEQDKDKDLKKALIEQRAARAQRREEARARGEAQLAVIEQRAIARTEAEARAQRCEEARARAEAQLAVIEQRATARTEAEARAQRREEARARAEAQLAVIEQRATARTEAEARAQRQQEARARFQNFFREIGQDVSQDVVETFAPVLQMIEEMRLQREQEAQAEQAEIRARLEAATRALIEQESQTVRVDIPQLSPMELEATLDDRSFQINAEEEAFKQANRIEVFRYQEEQLRLKQEKVRSSQLEKCRLAQLSRWKKLPSEKAINQAPFSFEAFQTKNLELFHLEQDDGQGLKQMTWRESKKFEALFQAWKEEGQQWFANTLKSSENFQTSTLNAALAELSEGNSAQLSARRLELFRAWQQVKSEAWKWEQLQLEKFITLEAGQWQQLTKAQSEALHMSNWGLNRSSEYQTQQLKLQRWWQFKARSSNLFKRLEQLNSEHQEWKELRDKQVQLFRARSDELLKQWEQLLLEQCARYLQRRFEFIRLEVWEPLRERTAEIREQLAQLGQEELVWERLRFEHWEVLSERSLELTLQLQQLESEQANQFKKDQLELLHNLTFAKALPSQWEQLDRSLHPLAALPYPLPPLLFPFLYGRKF